MTDPLITQAEAVIRAAVDDPTVPPAIVAWQAAHAIVDAGWTPPPEPLSYDDLLAFKERVDAAGYRTDPSVVKPIGFSDLFTDDPDLAARAKDIVRGREDR